MRIIIPCNWKTVNLLDTTNANSFGEALRNYCFIGNCEERGCYSTFKIHECFNKVESGKIYDEVKPYLWDEIKPTVYHLKVEEKDCYINYQAYGEIKSGSMKICEPHEIVIGWTWDGDGCLYFRFNDKKVVNTDCKKDYTWEWEK
jgi:predicted choloylglycine hydrolase